jgi:hypothetical protein
MSVLAKLTSYGRHGSDTTSVTPGLNKKLAAANKSYIMDP